MNTWKLWLDDQLDDPEVPARHTPAGFVGACSSATALALVVQHGPPVHVDLDHDLGGDDDALVFLRALSDAHFDTQPTWDVHSENPVGRDRINGFMQAWTREHADRANLDSRRVTIECFGKDHWSTFAYLETRIVDYQGVPRNAHMRTDVARHPHLAEGALMPVSPPRKYPTYLAGGVEYADHDDWDCADDLVAAGLLEDLGTGINRRYGITPYGTEVASALRAHKAAGRSLSQFRWPFFYQTATP